MVAAAVTVEADGPKTRFEILLSKPVAAIAHLLERPDRVVVDLPEVTFRLPGGVGQKREGDIASFRYGLFAPGQSRVVIDLAQPALVSGIRSDARPDGSSVLIIELSRASREDYRRAVAESAPKPPSAPVADAAGAEAPAADPRPVIVLDPGHGGVDPGAESLANTFEKDIVLAFARRLQGHLEETGHYRVLMTRNQDAFVSLEDRVRIAQAAKADLLISIHADTIPSGQQDVRGMTVYTRSERASDADSARLADRENKADSAAGIETREGPDEVTDILQELTLRETRAFSHNFAGKLVDGLEPVAHLNKNSRREARLWVLRAYDVPSVLLELGYLSNRKDYDLLASEDWRNKAAKAMAGAVERFFAPRLAKGGLLKENQPKQGAAAVLP